MSAFRNQSCLKQGTRAGAFPNADAVPNMPCALCADTGALVFGHVLLFYFVSTGIKSRTAGFRHACMGFVGRACTDAFASVISESGGCYAYTGLWRDASGHLLLFYFEKPEKPHGGVPIYRHGVLCDMVAPGCRSAFTLFWGNNGYAQAVPSGLTGKAILSVLRLSLLCAGQGAVRYFDCGQSFSFCRCSNEGHFEKRVSMRLTASTVSSWLPKAERRK